MGCPLAGDLAGADQGAAGAGASSGSKPRLVEQSTGARPIWRAARGVKPDVGLRAWYPNGG